MVDIVLLDVLLEPESLAPSLEYKVGWWEPCESLDRALQAQDEWWVRRDTQELGDPLGQQDARKPAASRSASERHCVSRLDALSTC
ncbi:MAG TPA: hypothetical protein DCQ06_04395 [Myxococcales bacterium]|nr:hypothetical protein [Myxococcales bacterium]HAN30816.1 hypothetical protein [Myxococcales bacterium]